MRTHQQAEEHLRAVQEVVHNSHLISVRKGHDSERPQVDDTCRAPCRGRSQSKDPCPCHMQNKDLLLVVDKGRRPARALALPGVVADQKAEARHSAHRGVAGSRRREDTHLTVDSQAVGNWVVGNRDSLVVGHRSNLVAAGNTHRAVDILEVGHAGRFSCENAWL